MLIKRVACVGAGSVGQSWATLFVSKGFPVNLQDISDDILKKAVNRIKSNLRSLEENNLLQKTRANNAIKLVETTNLIDEAVDNVDYVQESVPDTYHEKKKVFKEMDKFSSTNTILASSSSGLLMTEIQKETVKPGRCVLVHPVLPPHLIPLIEIAGGKSTSADTIKVTHDFMLKLGKVPVVLKKEVPGYIVNRLTAALWREAVSLVFNEVASAEDVDKAFCMGIGLRDPIIGPCLRAHIAGGGIERFIENFRQSYNSRWETMETWTSIPPKAAEKVIESTYEMKVTRTKTLNEIERERDEKLMKILRLMSKHPFY